MRIEEQESGAVLRLSVGGELDIGTYSALDRCLNAALAGRSSVELDMGDITFMDSSGAALLITATKRARERGAHLRILPNLSPQVALAFKLMGLNRILAAESS